MCNIMYARTLFFCLILCICCIDTLSLDFWKHNKKHNEFVNVCRAKDSGELSFSRNVKSNCSLPIIPNTINCPFFNSPLGSYNEHIELFICETEAHRQELRLWLADGTYVSGVALIDPATMEPLRLEYSVLDRNLDSQHLGVSNEPNIRELSLDDNGSCSIQGLNRILPDSLVDYKPPSPLRVLIMSPFSTLERLSDKILMFVSQRDKSLISLEVLSHPSLSNYLVNHLDQYGDVVISPITSLLFDAAFLRLLKEKAPPLMMNSKEFLDVCSDAVSADGDKAYSSLYDAASKILEYFSSFDVILYSDVGWEPYVRSIELSSITNIMKVSGSPKLLRYLIPGFQFHPSAHYFAADQYVIDSKGYLNQRWLSIQMGGKKELIDAVVILPPCLNSLHGWSGWISGARAVTDRSHCDCNTHIDLSADSDYFLYVSLMNNWDNGTVGVPHSTSLPVTVATPHFHILYIGQGSLMNAPGAFLKIVAKVKHLLCSLNDVIDNGSDLIVMATMIVGLGHITDEMFALNELLFSRADEFSCGNGRRIVPPVKVNMVMEDDIETCVSWLLKADLLVDPSTLSVNSFAFPMAAALHVPVIMYQSSYSKEWAVSGQVIRYVEECTVAAMAVAIVEIISDSVHHGRPGLRNCQTMCGVGFAASELFQEKSVVSLLENAIIQLHAGIDKTSKEGINISKTEVTEDLENDASLYANVIDSDLQFATKFHEGWLRQEQSLDEATNEFNCHSLVDEHDKKDIAVINHLMSSSSKPNNDGNSTILCGIFTIAPYHSFIDTILSTWGRQCDGFIAFSNTSDPLVSAVKVPLSGGESYDNMWGKTISIWMSIYHHPALLSQFDYFLLGGDDMYVSVGNLRKYLDSNEIKSASGNGSKAVYLGRTVSASYHLRYNSGGAGYILNRAAVAMLIHNIERNRCFKWDMVSIEDVMIGHCLALSGIFPHDTRERDEREREDNMVWRKGIESHNGVSLAPYTAGKERFHWHRPSVEYDFPLNSLYSRYSIFPQRFEACCSNQSISFHYIYSEKLMRCIHYVWKS